MDLEGPHLLERSRMQRHPNYVVGGVLMIVEGAIHQEVAVTVEGRDQGDTLRVSAILEQLSGLQRGEMWRVRRIRRVSLVVTTD